MKPCVSSYSFGRYFEQLGAEGVIEKAKEFGLSAIEFTAGGWTDNLSLDTAKRVREKAEELGIEIAALCVGADFLTGDTAAMLEQLRRCVDFAAAQPQISDRIQRRASNACKRMPRDNQICRAARRSHHDRKPWLFLTGRKQGRVAYQHGRSPQLRRAY